jgi:hypothetical protein
MFIHVLVTDINDAWASGGVSAPFDTISAPFDKVSKMKKGQRKRIYF